ncbi:uncharacterized protein LOC128670283 [Plodia interpunctella]|uniref:uncharacterized protein LOC128670283 n=1 Tax=Plodia interpunctella TaxID=58824 RepID=UPI002368E61D|nr:uncharacterized protein LOC128670283 [Plodia interpunctella]XP_053601811.1 uncharacterized protein LOC128670283 [Plodia interpunctella]XP_053601812.1 uncharacterized protein LOC128670283 [Plodia interpunctella]
MTRKLFTGNSYLFLFCMLCGGSFLFWPIYDIKENTTKSEIILDYQLLESADFKQQFTITTPGCEIPSMKPLDSSIKKFVISPNPEQCDESSANLLDHNETHIWTRKEISQEYDVLKCCYRAFNRTQLVRLGSDTVDERVFYQSCRNFSNHITANDEFVRVTCYNSSIEIHDQFFLYAPKKVFMKHNGIQESSAELGYNVLVMGIDAVSRLNLYRTMPKTMRYLKNNSAVELIGYNKVGDNTFPNLIPMLLGISVQELPRTCMPHKGSTFDNCPFVWEWFKQAGYYTALGEDSSWLGTFNYLRGGFLNTPTDYYIHTFISEVEKLMKKRKKTLCSNDKYLFQMLLDYAQDLTTTLKANKLFGFFWEITMSHDYLNNAAVMDESYLKFLNTLEANEYLEKTVLILVSDHGMRWGQIRSTKQGRLEERLPFVFILAPPSFRENYAEAYNNLQINSKRLTTPFNLNAMLNDLVNLDNINNEKILAKSKENYWRNRNISLFLPIPMNRTCQLAGISDHWCTCHKDIPISKENVFVKKGSEYMITYINNMLNTYRQCAQLTIAELLEAREMIAGEAEKDEVGWREFLIVARTKPGDAEFEATLRRHDDGQWALAGQVSRLNLYGNQSYCVDDNLLKLYCYCV